MRGLWGGLCGGRVNVSENILGCILQVVGGLWRIWVKGAQDPVFPWACLLSGLLSHQHPWLKGRRSSFPVLSAIQDSLLFPLPDLACPYKPLLLDLSRLGTRVPRI